MEGGEGRHPRVGQGSQQVMARVHITIHMQAEEGEEAQGRTAAGAGLCGKRRQDTEHTSRAEGMISWFIFGCLLVTAAVETTPPSTLP